MLEQRPRIESASLHHEILSGIAHPHWLKEGSLLDNVWSIATDNEEVSHGARKQLQFEVVLGPGFSSADADAEHDLITAKLLVIYGLSAGDGPFNAASTVPLLVRNYFQFVRWRLSRGISRNRDLTPEWLDELFETIRDEGILGLLPLGKRLAAFKATVRDGSIELPVREKGRQVHVSTDKVAAALGVQNFSQLTPSIQRQVIEFAVEQGCDTKSVHRKHVVPMGDESEEVGGDYEGLTSARIMTFLKPIDMLGTLRHRLVHDPIPFDPFGGERTPNSVAKALAAKSVGRTMTVPSYQACFLINQALCWVTDYAPDLKRYVAGMNALAPKLYLSGEKVSALQRLLSKTNAGFVPTSAEGSSGSLWPLHDRYSPGKNSTQAVATGRPTLRVALYEYLAVACMIVIAAFSARRREEIESMRAGCIKHEDGEPWLESWIAKTLRSVDLIPVPDSVAKAVETLEWLSELHREETGRPWLFEFTDPACLRDFELVDRWPRFNIYRALDRFAQFVGVPLLPNGERWTPKPHQFRRFFGVTYYHHYRFAHLTALSNFYRHYDPDMTRRYITEAARGGFLRRQQEMNVREKRELARQREFDLMRLEDFEEEAEAFRTERFTNVALGRERMSGHGGEQIAAQLKNAVDHIATVLEITPDSDDFIPTLGTMIAPIVDATRLEPNSLGHSYCKCTTNQVDLRQAACLKRREALTEDAPTFSAPDPAYAADTTCSGCAHNVQFDENRAYWDDAEAQEDAISHCALAPLLRALSERRLAAIREHKARCFK